MSTLKVTNLQHPSAASANVTLDASGNADFNGKNLAGVASVNGGQLGARNLVINGAMQVAQRGTSFSSPSNIYTLDRWFSTDNTGATVTVTQDSDSPDNFTNSAKITVNTPDTSLATNSVCLLRQNIEGVNFSKCGFGTSSAKTITISFWVKSSVTGQYSVAINNSAYNRSYVTGYTITSANTWEYKSVQISGDTSGTWLTDFSIGAAVHFPVAVQSGKITSGDAWTSGFNYGVTGQVNLVGTASATWQITGVQLEIGDTATDFEHESYGTTLQKCQRYYEESDREGFNFFGVVPSVTTNRENPIQFLVRKRATPSITFDTSALSYYHFSSNTVNTPSSVSASGIGVDGFFSKGTGMTARTAGDTIAVDGMHYKADAEL